MNILSSLVPFFVVISVIYLGIKYILIWKHRLKNKQNLLQKRSDMPFAKFLMIGDLYVAVTALLIVYFIYKKYF